MSGVSVKYVWFNGMIDRHIINTALWTFEDGGNLWLSLVTHSSSLSSLTLRCERDSILDGGDSSLHKPANHQLKWKGSCRISRIQKRYKFHCTTFYTSISMSEAFLNFEYFFNDPPHKAHKRERPIINGTIESVILFVALHLFFSIARCIHVSCDDGENCIHRRDGAPTTCHW